VLMSVIFLEAGEQPLRNVVGQGQDPLEAPAVPVVVRSKEAGDDPAGSGRRVMGRRVRVGWRGGIGGEGSFLAAFYVTVVRGFKGGAPEDARPGLISGTGRPSALTAPEERDRIH